MLIQQKSMIFRIPVDLDRDLRLMGEKLERSRAFLIRSAIKKYLAEKKLEVSQ